MASHIISLTSFLILVTVTVNNTTCAAVTCLMINRAGYSFQIVYLHLISDIALVHKKALLCIKKWTLPAQC